PSAVPRCLKNVAPTSSFFKWMAGSTIWLGGSSRIWIMRSPSAAGPDNVEHDGLLKFGHGVHRLVALLAHKPQRFVVPAGALVVEVKRLGAAGVSEVGHELGSQAVEDFGRVQHL
nr:hypothetical protein [Tanacetum cinerariifolium]